MVEEQERAKAVLHCYSCLVQSISSADQSLPVASHLKLSANPMRDHYRLSFLDMSVIDSKAKSGNLRRRRHPWLHEAHAWPRQRRRNICSAIHSDPLDDGLAFRWRCEDIRYFSKDIVDAVDIVSQILRHRLPIVSG